MPVISEETTEKYVVPAAAGGVTGLAAYEIAEKNPEIVGILAAVGAIVLITR